MILCGGYVQSSRKMRKWRKTQSKKQSLTWQQHQCRYTLASSESPHAPYQPVEIHSTHNTSHFGCSLSASTTHRPQQALPKEAKRPVKCKKYIRLFRADWVILLLASTPGPWNFRREFCVQQESSQGPAESEAEAKAVARHLAQWERSRPPGVSKVDLTTIWGHDKTPRADATSAAPAGA